MRMKLEAAGGAFWVRYWTARKVGAACSMVLIEIFVSAHIILRTTQLLNRDQIVCFPTPAKVRCRCSSLAVARSTVCCRFTCPPLWLLLR